MMQPEPRNPFEIASLRGRFARRSCPKGLHVISRGDNRQTVYYVLSGIFAATMYSQEGKKLTLGRIRAGDAFGELAAIDRNDRSVTVEALTDAEVLSIERAVFLEIVLSHPACALWLLERMSARIRVLTDKVFELSLLSVRQVLLSELQRVAASEEMGEVEGSTLLPTQSELASRIGTNRETVSREIANLVREGAIEVDGRSFRVLRHDQAHEAW